MNRDRASVARYIADRRRASGELQLGELRVAIDELAGELRAARVDFGERLASIEMHLRMIEERCR